jgi:hypothetical protein
VCVCGRPGVAYHGALPPPTHPPHLPMLSSDVGPPCSCPHPGLFLHYGDLTDSSNLCSIVARTRPHEVYNLGAQSHVKGVCARACTVCVRVCVC